MNIYLVVEGASSELQIYRKWVKFVNPAFDFVDNIDEVENDNVYMISGFGHPQYLKIIKNGVLDVSANSKFEYHFSSLKLYLILELFRDSRVIDLSLSGFAL